MTVSEFVDRCLNYIERHTGERGTASPGLIAELVGLYRYLEEDHGNLWRLYSSATRDMCMEVFGISQPKVKAKPRRNLPDWF